MPGRGTRHHAIRIPDDLWQAALAKAERRGETVAEVIREALRRYVEQDDERRSSGER
jgi:predicted DNA-binding protein